MRDERQITRESQRERQTDRERGEEREREREREIGRFPRQRLALFSNNADTNNADKDTINAVTDTNKDMYILHQQLHVSKET